MNKTFVTVRFAYQPKPDSPRECEVAIRSAEVRNGTEARSCLHKHRACRFWGFGMAFGCMVEHTTSGCVAGIYEQFSALNKCMSFLSLRPENIWGFIWSPEQLDRKTEMLLSTVQTLGHTHGSALRAG